MDVNRNKDAETRARITARVLGRLSRVVAKTKTRGSARKRARDGRTRAVAIVASHLEMTGRVRNKRRASRNRANVTRVPNCGYGSAIGRRKILVACENRIMIRVK